MAQAKGIPPKKRRTLTILLFAALLLGIWSAWYSHPRTLEELAPEFRWEEISKVQLTYFTASYPPTKASGEDRRQLSLPQEITLSPEELAPWQEAAFKRRPLATLHYRLPGIELVPVKPRCPVSYRYIFCLHTDVGIMEINVFHDRLIVRWFDRDRQRDYGPWVLTPPDGLLTATGENFLPYAVQINND